MITLTVELVLGVLLVIVLMNIFKKKPAPPPVPAGPVPDLANLGPNDARTGDSISIAGAGDQMTDLDFTIDRTTWFQAGSRTWLEFGGPYRERRIALRVANNEEVEVALNPNSQKLTLEDIGVSEDDLGQMDERQNTGDSFEYDSKVWLYRLSREVQSKRDDQPQSIGFYYWEFQEQNGKGLLSVRKLEGEPFAVARYQEIPAADVTVYRGSRG